MQKSLIIATLTATLALAMGLNYASAHDMTGQGRGYMMEPGYGGYMMGPGYGGHMTGPGYDGHMMGYGHEYGYGKGDCAYGPSTQAPTVDAVKAHLQNMLDHRGNPRLKVGSVTENETTITGEVVTLDGSLVEKYAIDKKTGAWQRVLD